MALRRLGKSLNSAIDKFVRRGPLDKDLIKELKNDIIRSLTEADIDIKLALKVATNVEQRSLTEKLPPGLERKKAVINILYEELTAIMGSEHYPLNITKGKLNIVMTLGIQGSGKTTTIGKLANKLKREGWKIGVICADTWRPGAYDQLKQLLSPLQIPVYGDQDNKNAVKIATKGINFFQKNGIDVVLIDTAGRHTENESLMKEMRNLSKKLSPDEIILVIDGTSGSQIKNTAERFREATPIGSIIVTKLDGTAKGGGAISASASAGVPIKYIGIGEGIEDLEDYDPKKFVGRVLGMGDLESLLEEVKKANLSITEDQTEAMLKGKMSFNDILTMFESMNKMGGFRKILDMVGGGLTHQVDDNMLNMSKENMTRFKTVISSMTPKEKNGDVKLNYTRIERIARGSGTTPEVVKELVNQKKMAEKMVRQMTKPRRKGRGGQAQGLPFGFPPFG